MYYKCLGFLLSGFVVVFLNGCGGLNIEKNEVKDRENERLGPGESGGIFGDGITFGGLGDKPEGSDGGVAVNSFLWRASLDTIAFFPLAQADPFGGVITTDWYRPVDAPNERYKLNVFILGRQLRSNALRVVVFRQNLQEDGLWLDSTVKEEVSTKLEEAILTRARKLRVVERSETDN
ncbi:MAG: DUF3576 domain-containing protein [Pseudomonadota bacterium]